MVTLTSIASEVFDSVATEVDGVIKTMAFTRSVKGEYDTETGSYATTTLEYTGRGLAETENLEYRVKNDFPGYVFTSKETLWFAAELEQPPQNSDEVEIDGRTLKIVGVRDILGTGELYRLLMI